MLICTYCGKEAQYGVSCCGEVHFEEIQECPECKSTDTNQHHHEGSAAVPECTYMECSDCGHQWNHN